MKNNKAKQSVLKESKELALHYMKTLVEVARESFLILDENLKVISANPLFYQTFQVTQGQTEKKYIYELGNGQWDIRELRNLLEQILPEEKIVKNYEVEHVFENIGKKTILLNARQIDSVQLIILALEDITERKNLETKMREYTKDLETRVAKRTTELELRLKELERINKIMVGREMKMIELKDELAKLKKSRKA